MKRSLSAIVTSAALAAGLLAFAPTAMASEAAAACLPTDTMTSFERIDRKTLRFTNPEGHPVVVSTQGRCTIKAGDPVRLIQRGETACLSKGDRLRSVKEECRVSSVTTEKTASNS